jgi:hypothetical protein
LSCHGRAWRKSASTGAAWRTEGLARWVRSELARLDLCSRTLVELLAVVEDLIDLNELTQMAGNPGADVERALERLVSTGMIVKQGSSQYA